jgi:hypothetical protein
MVRITLAILMLLQLLAMPWSAQWSRPHDASSDVPQACDVADAEGDHACCCCCEGECPCSPAPQSEPAADPLLAATPLASDTTCRCSVRVQQSGSSSTAAGVGGIVAVASKPRTTIKPARTTIKPASESRASLAHAAMRPASPRIASIRDRAPSLSSLCRWTT